MHEELSDSLQEKSEICGCIASGGLMPPFPLKIGHLHDLNMVVNEKGFHVISLLSKTAYVMTLGHPKV